MALVSWFRALRTGALLTVLACLVLTGVAFVQGASTGGAGLLAHHGSRGLLCAGFLLVVALLSSPRSG